MENKEAIAILERLQEPEAWEPQISEDAYTALQMAIDALGADTNFGSKGDMIYRQDAIHVVSGLDSSFVKYIEELPSAQPEPCEDAVSRKAVIRLLHTGYHSKSMIDEVKELPPAKPEPLTDREQRIFLAAMGREEKVCEEVDRNHIREAYEDSLMWICREIKRKVKGALWT